MRSVALGWIEARSSGAIEGLAMRLRGAIEGMAQARPDLALRTLTALCSALAKHPDFGPAAISMPAVARLLAWARSAPGQVDLRDLAVLTSVLDPRYFDVVLETLLASEEGPVKDLMLAWLARPNAGNEERFGELAGSANEELGLAIVRVLDRIGTPTARAAIVRGCTSPHAVVRIEALGHVEGTSSERLRKELKALLEDNDASLRVAALNTIQKNAVRIAGPSLVLRIRSSKFDALSPDEKRMALETLAVLAPRRAEDVCIELLKNASLLPSESREQTRLLAAQLLGEIAQSDDAVEALSDVAGSRWRSSEKLRNVAGQAQARLSRPPAGLAPGVSVIPFVPGPAPVPSFPPARPSWVPPKDKP